MAFTDELIAAKDALKGAGVDVYAVLAEAGIDQSTWSRWNSGRVRGPHWDTWQKFKGALARMVGAPVGSDISSPPAVVESAAVAGADMGAAQAEGKVCA